jgi:AbrB family looped-hinge helix DNA binding protein
VNLIPGDFGRTAVDDGGPRSLQLQGTRLLAAVGRTAANGGERQLTREIRAMAGRRRRWFERHRSALSLHHHDCKESPMEIAARMSSKGQVTVPKAVREALGLGEGDDVVFRVEGDRAVLARTPEFLSLAGTVAVPAAKRNVAWDEVIRSTRAGRAAAAR